MNRQQRTKLIENQTRAFSEGIVEFINDQWVFFDNETDEASLLDEFIQQDIEVYRFKRWKKGSMLENGKVSCSDELFHLKDQDQIRIRKLLVFSLERLLDEVNDDAFFQFVTNLNSINFSIFDCIYCYNQLTFFNDGERKSGVNFMIFDNQEYICSVQHHFFYYENETDRFEFTLNSGKRMVIEKISS
ncbi:DUF2777 domain-containing protein [Cytobacillus purgationiresistens]|uniref:DUF2777 domain-containing protein n=1 Tax=Cytobacillus purgationiresistens TaxID=863449 RepID=A0ABU0ACL6_9BACI|nr:DUF2777 domain-containing protein [Cytobacillus purgationiresistens]MDQ0268785.1 hypothetical protein [Cytobacillus purgationiresistens]